MGRHRVYSARARGAFAPRAGQQRQQMRGGGVLKRFAQLMCSAGGGGGGEEEGLTCADTRGGRRDGQHSSGGVECSARRQSVSLEVHL